MENKLQWIHPGNQQIHLELSSSCQAYCPACSRVYDYSSHLPDRKHHSSWDLSRLIEVFSKDFLGQISEFLLCGNYGDPLAFEQIDKFIGHILENNPNISFVIHTNGGLGTKAVWKNLAELLKDRKHKVRIAIDGLEDTNHIYRRGVDWPTLMENMKVFIHAGGLAHWKFIEFDHNKHQIERARELADKLGFSSFEVKKPYGQTNGHIDQPLPSDLPTNTQQSFSKEDKSQLIENCFSQLDTSNEISCKVVENPSLYFDHDQRVWPCCWLAQDGDHRTRTKKRELFFREVYDKGVDLNFNSLKEFDLLSILAHPFFQDMLPQSWNQEKVKEKKCFSTCLSTCAKAKD